MKNTRKNLVTAAASGAFALGLLVTLLSACGKSSHHYDDCDALALAAYEAPARPAPHPASRPRVSLRKPAPRPAPRPVARPATTHHVVVHHAAPRPATTHHVVVHHVVHPAPVVTHHVVVHHAHPTHHVVHHHHDIC
ncbi:hypothetical protein [Actinacidiphila sp. ITFR-21]|uniref:hypothetical protein n=1 Tax=Actinacidiphila sp. ITFR-21 TaxID=3075199 RepID=UPI00288C4787|nr:hypothetical protein [Streptomyces sp. ITFR-21]WNI20329.1 hypothetical protein RLT57_32515 [Streptomyces sp. ITFR-21]